MNPTNLMLASVVIGALVLALFCYVINIRLQAEIARKDIAYRFMAESRDALRMHNEYLERLLADAGHSADTITKLRGIAGQLDNAAAVFAGIQAPDKARQANHAAHWARELATQLQQKLAGGQVERAA